MCESVNCIICGRDDTSVFLQVPGAVRIVKCRNDGLLYLNPRPKRSSIHDIHTRYVRADNLDIFSGYWREVLAREAAIIKRFKSSGLQLLYPPVDTKKFHPGGDVTATRQELGIPPDCPVIGIVANLCPGKGQEYFLEAAQVIRSRYPRAKFLVVGAPLKNRLAFWHALQEQTIRMQLQRDVIFTGRRSDVPQLLRTMTVCVQASEAEACPMAALEAGASGVPVVATNVGGTREIVEDGITGMLIEPRNPERKAWAVLHLLDSPESARQMGLAAVRRMRERFSLETCAATHARMYDLVLRRGTRGIPVRGDDAEAEVDSIEDVYSRN